MGKRHHLRLDEDRVVSRDIAAAAALQIHLPALHSLVPLILRRDQTLTWFGFEPANCANSPRR